MDDGSLRTVFERAANYARGLATNLSSNELLQLYGLFKQATIGPNKTPQPSWIYRTDRSKWEVWSSQGEKSCATAMVEYINLVTTFDPKWQEQESSSAGSWVHHSSLAANDEPLTEGDKTIFDWVKENNVKALQTAASAGENLSDAIDIDGLALLHWAADRGNVESVNFLLANGLDVNVVDSDGQTPLHYAATCGHLDVVKQLLAAGATTTLHDCDGLTPGDVAATTDISQLLKTFPC